MDRHAHGRRIVPVLVLILLATIVTAGTLHPRTVTAAMLTASITVDADADSHLSPADRTAIYEQLKTVWELHQKDAEKAWACTQSPGQDEPLLTPLAPRRVRAEVTITRRGFFERLWGGDYDITVRLTVEGQRNGQQQAVESAATDEGDDQETHSGTVRELGRRAADKLAILLAQFSPCTAKAALRLEGSFAAEAIATTVRVQAEGELNLREDGTTEAVFPVSFTRTQSGACTISTTATGRLQVTGDSRSDDGALALRMLLSLDPETGSGTCVGEIRCAAGGGAITCTGPGGSASQPDPGIELDLTPGDGVVIALADQASVALPRPSGWFEGYSWDAALQLAYGAGSGDGVALRRGVAAAPAP